MTPPWTKSTRMIRYPGKRALRRVVTAMSLAMVPATALAYLDPSTGSMLVSAIIGIFASIALAVKTYWYRLKGLFRRKSQAQPEAHKDSSGRP